MIPTGWLVSKAKADPGWIARQSERRKARRAMFSSAEGRRMLADIIRSGHILEQTQPEDRDAASKRNFAIAMLDDLGLLDEASIDAIAGFLLTLPVMPEAVADAIEEGEGNGR